jgi:hypothetical protein
MAWVGTAQAQDLPMEQENLITAYWLVQQEDSGQLVPYIAEQHKAYNALHQWVSVAQAQPFRISFAAPKDLCLFLNNQLVFKADYAANYTLDLATLSKNINPVEGKYLLTVWHPEQQPNVRTFRSQLQHPETVKEPDQRPLSVRVRKYVNQNAFILFLLLVGLVYGVLRTSYPNDFRGLYRFEPFDRRNTLEEGGMVKPIRSLSSIFFILAFSLTLALLIAAIHTNLQQVKLFNRFFPVSEFDITTKILFYTLLIFFVIISKYLFLKFMGFIFGLEQVVQTQYREFIKSMLFMGIFLPLIMLLYLALNAVMPETILLLSSIAVSFVLIITVMRVFLTVNKKAPVLNLHLFSYLCATEVIPLAIMLKLIVFNF